MLIMKILTGQFYRKINPSCRKSDKNILQRDIGMVLTCLKGGTVKLINTIDSSAFFSNEFKKFL